jgi:hypothetical protein
MTSKASPGKREAGEQPRHPIKYQVDSDNKNRQVNIKKEKKIQ